MSHISSCFFSHSFLSFSLPSASHFPSHSYTVATAAQSIAAAEGGEGSKEIVCRGWDEGEQQEDHGELISGWVCTDQNAESKVEKEEDEKADRGKEAEGGKEKRKGKEKGKEKGKGIAKEGMEKLRLVGMDCEMCETWDDEEPMELTRVSVVDDKGKGKLRLVGMDCGMCETWDDEEPIELTRVSGVDDKGKVRCETRDKEEPMKLTRVSVVDDDKGKVRRGGVRWSAAKCGAMWLVGEATRGRRVSGRQFNFLINTPFFLFLFLFPFSFLPRSLQVLLDRLVKPQREVKSYVTEITGLKEEDFKKVQYTWEDAQVRSVWLKEEDFKKVKYTWEDAQVRSVLHFLSFLPSLHSPSFPPTLSDVACQRDVAALLTPNTVLVGHHVSGDMDVLKIDHPLVIDTSLLFRYASTLRRLKALPYHLIPCHPVPSHAIPSHAVLKIDHPLVIDTSLLFRYSSVDSNMSTVQLPLALVALALSSLPLFFSGFQHVYRATTPRPHCSGEYFSCPASVRLLLSQASPWLPS
ncbi:unnamed protein product [Closterium sp. NIES-53]